MKCGIELNCYRKSSPRLLSNETPNLCGFFSLLWISEFPLLSLKKYVGCPESSSSQSFPCEHSVEKLYTSIHEASKNSQSWWLLVMWHRSLLPTNKTNLKVGIHNKTEKEVTDRISWELSYFQTFRIKGTATTGRDICFE